MRPTNSDNNMARPYCAAVGVGGGGGVFAYHFFFSFTLSLEDASIQTEILSERPVKPKTTNQPKTDSRE